MRSKNESAVKRLTATQWQEAVSDTFFPLETTMAEGETFAGAMNTWNLGIVGLSHMRCDGILYKRHKRHFLDEVDSSLLITIPRLGNVGFNQNARQANCSPGEFLVERGDLPYEFWHEQTNELLVLKVSSESVRARIGPTDRLAALSFDGTAGVASYFLDVVKTTAEHVDLLDEAARSAAGKHILDLLCLAIRKDDRVLDSNTSTIRAAHLHRAEQFIRNNLSNENLSSSLVAEACNVSLRYLQQLFLDADKSISGFIREKRLIRAREDLCVEGTITIAEIAHRWGFSDQSQFNKAYRAQFGCTPTETRRSAQQVQGAASP
ncbi:AraC family transcriptional regulator [Roseobacter denitrificans]|uniref:Transcriptional regulator, AraC family, putative n=1 Tax=Roseobacter denitrificans (strain ATCC 33942 / OCh 114) TaxID=375451 RepID=Q162N1_ROSDO|nr:helix-turn-helix domain-containing protein [Roseobacter denitrificans]ABG33062.1 transcriptional regulator, AraC family, putative [Roseobacter denitrificans OCh 114]AVL52435.1 AraC family transcriptional regulator [Roseobacter denitrificans]SFG08603.1 AraC-type DNA-binding protein [Roseobacter denitrificans OCh 114]